MTDALPAAAPAPSPAPPPTPSPSPSIREIAVQGLWTSNPALVQVLGLCPLLAVTGSVVNATGLGVATIGVLVGSNVAVSIVRNHVADTVRLPAFVMIIASLTTCVTLLMQAFAFELYQVMALFVQIIVTNCVILGRAEAFASRHPVLPAATDGLMMGLGFTAVLVVLGAIREVLGSGTLFAGMDLLFGPAAAGWEIELIHDYRGFLIAALPPGAFIAMGFLMALKNVIDARIERRRLATRTLQVGARRVRVTGTP